MFDFASKKKWFFLGSAIVIIIGIISMSIFKFNTSIEFTSGTTMTMVFKEPISQDKLRTALDKLGHSEAFIQHSEKKNAFIFYDAKAMSGKEITELNNALEKEFGTVKIPNFETETETVLGFLFNKDEINKDALVNKITSPKPDGLGLEEAKIEPMEAQSFFSLHDFEIGEIDKLKDALEEDENFGPVRIATNMVPDKETTLGLIFDKIVSEEDLKAKITAMGYDKVEVEPAKEDSFFLVHNLGTAEQVGSWLKSTFGSDDSFGKVKVANFGTETKSVLGLIFGKTVDETKLEEELTSLGYDKTEVQSANSSFVIKDSGTLTADDISKIKEEIEGDENFGTVGILSSEDETGTTLRLIFNKAVDKDALQQKFTTSAPDGLGYENATVEFAESGFSFTIHNIQTVSEEKISELKEELEKGDENFGTVEIVDFGTEDKPILCLNFDKSIDKDALEEKIISLYDKATVETMKGTSFLILHNIGSTDVGKIKENLENDDNFGTVKIADFGIRNKPVLGLNFGKEIDKDALQSEITDLGYEEATVEVVPLEDNSSFIFCNVGKMGNEDINNLKEALEEDFGAVDIVAFEPEGETELGFIFNKVVSKDDLENKLEGLGYSKAEIESTKFNSFLVRTKSLRLEGKDAEGNIIPSEESEIEKALEKEFGSLSISDVSNISPVIASERVHYTIIAVIVAAIVVLLYIALAFRKLPSPFRYGVCAIVALVHDVLVVLGIFSILGVLFGIEFDSSVIIGILTIIGYSVNDTIVVFDRVRENINKGISRDFETTVNVSLTEVLGRSLNTSLTTFIVLLALALLGGVTIRSLVIVLIIGIISGTYSSIFIASQVLVVWEEGGFKKFFSRIPVPGLARGK